MNTSRLLDKATSTLEHRIVGDGIPLLLVYAGEGAKPAVIALHGFIGKKEDMLYPAMEWARQGYLVAAPDAHLHGERSVEDFLPRFAANFPREFLHVVVQTALDLPALIDYLRCRDDVLPDRIGVLGASMGGFIALIGATLDKRPAAVASVAGGADYEAWLQTTRVFDSTGWRRDLPTQLDDETRDLMAQYDPLMRLEQFWDTPLLMMHGELDDIVSSASHVRLYHALRPYYQQAPERLGLKLRPGVGHEGILDMLPEAMDWLTTYLGR